MPEESDPPTQKLDDATSFALWSKYEDVAMHFNDLIIRLRIQALGGVTAVFALSGIAINIAGTSMTSEQLDVIFGTLVFLIFAWMAIACLDLFYYYTLLLGAVDALLEIEKSDERFILSTRIERRFRRQGSSSDGDIRKPSRWFSERCWPLWFYGIGLTALVCAAVTTRCVKLGIDSAATQSPTPMKINVDRVKGERLELKIDGGDEPKNEGK